MSGQAVFGRRGAVTPARVSPVRRATTATAEVETVEPSTSYADLSGAQRMLAALPVMTVAFALGLWVIWRLQLAFAFDVGAGGQLSVDSLVAEGADSYDLAIGQGQIWRIVLAPLLHSSTSHLFGNCLAMVLIGVLLEVKIGRGWYAAIFAASAIGGEIGSLAANSPWVPGVGASGAITGLLAAAFVMSFSADTAEEGWRMLKRALFFGVPALAPLLWGAHGHVNYYAHLGGALAGGVIMFVVDQTWDRADFRPLFNRQAAAFAAVFFSLAIPATALAATQFATRRADAAQFIPMADLQANLDKIAKKAPEYERRYPKDPMTKILTGVFDAENGHMAEGEAALRAAMAMEVPARPWAERPLHAMAQGFLAILLQAEHRPRDAHQLSDPLCRDADQENIVAMLRGAKLCGKD